MILLSFNVGNNSFDVINNASILSNFVNKMVRMSYDTTQKKIYIGPKRKNTISYLFHYNMCNVIDSYTTTNFSFSFKDLDVSNSIVTNINVEELMNILDIDPLINDTNDTNDYESQINKDISDVSGLISANKIKLLEDIKTNQGLISDLQKINSTNYGNESSSQKIIDNNNEIRAAYANVQGLISKLDTAYTRANSLTDEIAIETANDNILIIQGQILDGIIDYYNTVDTNNYLNYQLVLDNWNKLDTAWLDKKRVYDLVDAEYKTSLKYVTDGDSQQKYISNNIWRIVRNTNCSWGNNNNELHDIVERSAIRDIVKVNWTAFVTWDQCVTTEFIGMFRCYVSGFYYFNVNSDDAGEISIGQMVNGVMVYTNVANFYGGHGAYAWLTTYLPIYLDSNVNGGFYGLHIICSQGGGPTGEWLYYAKVPNNVVGNNYYTLNTDPNAILNGVDHRISVNNTYVVNFYGYNYTIGNYCWLGFSKFWYSGQCNYSLYEFRYDATFKIYANTKSTNADVAAASIAHKKDVYNNRGYVNIQSDSPSHSGFYYEQARNPSTLPDIGIEPVKPNEAVRTIRNSITYNKLVPSNPNISLRSLQYTPVVVPNVVVTNTSYTNFKTNFANIPNYGIQYGDGSISSINAASPIITEDLSNDASINSYENAISYDKNAIVVSNSKLTDINTLSEKITTAVTPLTFQNIKSKLNTANNGKGVKIPPSVLPNYQNNIFKDNLTNYYIYAQINFISSS